MGVVYGKDVIISIPDLDAHIDMPIGCARSATFDIKMDTIETSQVGYAQFRTYTTGAVTVSGSIDGLVFISDGTSSTYDLGRMMDAIMSGTIFSIKFYETDFENVNYLQKECNVIFESITETASFDNVNTFSASFKGTGTPTITYGTI